MAVSWRLARDALLGLAEPPSASPSVAEIGRAWRRRWLENRILRDETLDEVAVPGPASVRLSLYPALPDQLPLDIG